MCKQDRREIVGTGLAREAHRIQHLLKSGEVPMHFSRSRMMRKETRLTRQQYRKSPVLIGIPTNPAENPVRCCEGASWSLWGTLLG